MTSFDRIEEDEQPIFTCPSCGKNIFDVGITECAAGADISTVVIFGTIPPFQREPEITSAEHRWIKCNNCHNRINIDVDQLDAVFSGRCTEEQMKIQCKIIQRPVFLCPSCKLDLFKEGIEEITTGGESCSKIIFDKNGHHIDPALTSDITEQWSECSNCGARIDIDATDLINYYEGECTYNDIARDDLNSE